MPDEVYGASAPDMDELLKMIGKEKQVHQPFAFDDDSTKLFLVHTTLGATARVGTTLGKGVCRERYLAISGADRVITATSYTEDIEFFNLSSSTVGADKYLMLLRFGDVLLANWEEC